MKCTHCALPNPSFTCGHKCDNAVYCEQKCANNDYAFHAINACIDVSHVGIIEVAPGGFTMIRMPDLDGTELYTIAKNYVQEKKLGWNIQPPFAWTEKKTGPHITLDPSMAKYKGERVRVMIQNTITHFVDYSRWITLNVKLVGTAQKLKCGTGGCHISIGQQRPPF